MAINNEFAYKPNSEKTWWSLLWAKKNSFKYGRFLLVKKNYINHDSWLLAFISIVSFRAIFYFSLFIAIFCHVQFERNFERRKKNEKWLVIPNPFQECCSQNLPAKPNKMNMFGNTKSVGFRFAHSHSVEFVDSTTLTLICCFIFQLKS